MGHSNEFSVHYWQLAVLLAGIFVIFLFSNANRGVMHGINIEAVSEGERAFAAGLTVSFQNIFGFACGPLLPSVVVQLVGCTVQAAWPDVLWNQQALDGAKFAAGM